jgi:phospholipid/cholesterol/gamma-HCH transport system substrate-binding protein
MKKFSLETSVGIFVLIGILCIGYLAVKLGKMEWMGNNNYGVTAVFETVSGLKTGAQVEMAGVPIGQVDSITLDQNRQAALVRFKIKNGVVLTDDVIASVKTSGLIGDKFIKITPGGSDEILKNGDSIVETESALDIEDLISKYAFGSVE